jgi:hypothetical protein
MSGDYDFVARHGASVNANGGIYISGAAYSYTKKLEVAMAYRHGIQQNPPVSVASIAKKCSVSRPFVDRIIDELDTHNRVLHPSTVVHERRDTKLCGFSAAVVLRLYMEEPGRSTRSYRDLLYEYTGLYVSESTISRFFLHNFPYRGSMVKPNLVPLDKFRPTNLAKLIDFIDFIVRERPDKIKFGDEKHLKGQEMYSRKVRRNPITGEVPAILTNSDFRRTHNITGFCGMDQRTNPLWFKIERSVDGNNNANSFFDNIVEAIMDGFLRPGDVLVLDNAPIHTGGDNTVLADWLWSRFEIFVAWLPTRSPELNPIELVWSYLVSKLKTYPLTTMRENMRASGCSTDAVAYVAREILDGVSHEFVWKCFKHCYKDIMKD